MKKMTVTGTNDAELIEVEIGSQHTVIIDKLFGPTGFAQIRIKADVGRNAWVIERWCFGEEWQEYATVPGQLPQDYANDE